MTAKVIKFPKELAFDAVKNFGQYLSAAKHDYSWSSEGDIDLQILSHTINTISCVSQELPSTLTYYLWKYLGYNGEQAAQVLTSCEKNDILLVLGTKMVNAEYMAIRRFTD